jgi:hypothetical protein
VLLQGRNLGLGINPALGCRLGVQSLQALLEGLQVVPEPGAADPGRRDEDATLSKLIAGPHLIVRPLSARAIEDQRLLVLIRASYAASGGVYGQRRVFQDLRQIGETCGKQRVARIMKANGI